MCPLGNDLGRLIYPTVSLAIMFLKLDFDSNKYVSTFVFILNMYSDYYTTEHNAIEIIH